jgi:hypothetical protein
MKAKKKKKIIHYPKLDTILMVEKFIKDNSGEYKKKSLWQNLPRKMMYQTYCVIFDYLIELGKIGLDRYGHIAWIWDPKGARYYLNHPELKYNSQ